MMSAEKNVEKIVEKNVEKNVAECCGVLRRCCEDVAKMLKSEKCYKKVGKVLQKV